MSLKKLMTTTALTIAVAMPAFADGHAVEADVEAEAQMGVEGDTTLAAEGDVSTELDEMGNAIADAADDAADAVEEAVDADATMMADADVDAEAGFDFTGMTVEDLIGMEVQGSEGEVVGEIDYVFINDGEYNAVIGVGGLLGLGENDVALPLDSFEMGEDGMLRLSGATEAQLEGMQEVDFDTIEMLADDHVIS